MKEEKAEKRTVKGGRETADTGMIETEIGGKEIGIVTVKGTEVTTARGNLCSYILPDWLYCCHSFLSSPDYSPVS